VSDSRRWRVYDGNLADEPYSQDVLDEIALTFDEVAEQYDMYYSGDDIDVEDSVIASVLNPVAKGARILDLGCGTARVSTQLGVEYESYHGVDISQGMLDRAPTDRGQRYTRAALETWEPTEEYDLVLGLFNGVGYTPIERVFELTVDALGEAGGFHLMFPTRYLLAREYQPLDDVDRLRFSEWDDIAWAVAEVMDEYDDFVISDTVEFQPIERGEGVMAAMGTPAPFEPTGVPHSYRVVAGGLIPEGWGE